jgi:hypothetical protein
MRTLLAERIQVNAQPRGQDLIFGCLGLHMRVLGHLKRVVVIDELMPEDGAASTQCERRQNDRNHCLASDMAPIYRHNQFTQPQNRRNASRN